MILGHEMLKPQDRAGKEEGELTGGKRLLENLNKRYGHFADMIVADALYLNAPFINTVLELVEAIFLLTILGFNIRELYLYHRIRNFETSGITRKSVSRKFRDDLLIEDVKEALYRESG